MKTKIKKSVYIFLVILLGFLLSTIAHSLLEGWFVNYNLSEGIIPEEKGFFGFACYLPEYLSYLFFGMGIIGGYFLGKTWWRIVYVEKRRWRKRKK